MEYKKKKSHVGSYGLNGKQVGKTGKLEIWWIEPEKRERKRENKHFSYSKDKICCIGRGRCLWQWHSTHK